MVFTTINAKCLEILNTAKKLEKHLISLNISKTQEKIVFQLYSSLIKLMEDYKKTECLYSSFFIAKALIETCAHLRLSYQDRNYAYFRQWEYFNDIDRKMNLAKSSEDPLLQKFYSSMANSADSVREIKKVIASVVRIKDLEKRYLKKDNVLRETNLYEIYNFFFHNLSVYVHSEFFPIEDIFEEDTALQLSLTTQSLLQKEIDQVTAFFGV
ncbi:MAG: hypothetical protein FJ161_03715 [Gammaproteobacteria bacterium]|nr:hypothetical protein [Gammaproteobacteria bacterium]